MPRNSTGKWVQRAASTGGGRTYRGQRPVNWYASLVVIAVLGLLSIAWARYENQHPATHHTVGPTVNGTPWHAALSVNICGTEKPPLPASPTNAQAGMTTDGTGVLVMAPKTSAQAGNNAILSQFLTYYPKLTLTDSTLGYPGQQVWKTGDKCPKGTPDAGKTGTVQVAYWNSFTNSLKDYQVVADPLSLKPADRSVITMAFVPKGSTIARSGTALSSMLKAAENSATPPTTLPSTTPTTPTTAPAVTPTTAPAATTTTTTPTTTSTTSKK